MKKKLKFALCLCLWTAGSVCAQKPETFLPGVISTGLNERDMAVAPDGKEMFYTIQAPRNGLSVIVRRTLRGPQWSEAEVASFSGQFSDLEAAYSSDGQRLFFVSNRPLAIGGPRKDYDIWYLDKKGQDWGEPINAGPAVNTSADEYYPSTTADGSVYFTAARPDALGKEDIYKSRWSGNQFQAPENIGGGVNSALDEFNAFVDPLERYILFSAEGGQGDLGRGDLYICYRNGDGSWGKAGNLGAPVNSSRLDYCPYVHGDTFYFTSERPTALPDRKMTFAEIKLKLEGWGNGQGDIYSMPVSQIYKPGK